MSVATVAAALAAKIVTDTSVSSVFTNALWRRQRIPAGSTYACILDYVAGYWRTSNDGWLVAQYDAVVLHHLSDPTSETAYDTNRRTDMGVLMDPSWWRVTGVKHEIGDPELTPQQRIGNVIEYTVSMQLVIS